jgi:hypothetical protein
MPISVSTQEVRSRRGATAMDCSPAAVGATATFNAVLTLGNARLTPVSPLVRAR